MPVPARTPQRRHSPAVAAAIGGLLLVVATACTDQSPSADPSPATPTPTAESTPLADYDASAVTVARAAFCDLVPDDAVAAALSAEPSDSQSWRPGRRLPDSPAISNEFGCSWSADERTARAWVFAPPITSDRAGDLVDEVVAPKCRRLRSAPPLGSPSVTQSCTLNTGATLVAISGLVGDAWVSCEISGTGGPAEPDTDVVGEWCVAVLEALRTT